MGKRKQPKGRMSEGDVVGALAAKYAGDSWAFFPQVPDGTGRHKNRTADAIAMSLWPSRGLEIHGFEVKVSRQDWLKELKEHRKADRVARYCDRWWIVAGAGKLVDPDELPKGWGLMVPHGSTFRAARQAKPREDVQPLDRAFIAGLLRAATKAFEKRYRFDAQLREHYRQGYEAGKKWEEQQSERLRRDIERLQQAQEEFYRASGVSIGSYQGGKIGEAVRIVQGGGLRAMRPAAQIIKDRAAHLATIADQILQITNEG